MSESPQVGQSASGFDPGGIVFDALYRAGWDAYMARKTISSNPHEFGSAWWVAWREGFTDAEGERHKELTARGL